MIRWPSAELVATLIAGAVLLGAATAGYQHARAKCEAEQQRQRAELAEQHHASLQRAIEQAEAMAREDAAILQAAAERESARQTITRTLTREVTRHVASPVYTDCRLDDCELCLARSAAAGAPDPAGCPCGADDPLPAAGGPGAADQGRASASLRGDGGPAAHLP
ncbi:MAG: hypothetical protein AB7U81_11975 [Thiohalomonadaceae bacterium]